MIAVQVVVDIEDIDTAHYTEPRWSNGDLQVDVEVVFNGDIDPAVTILGHTMFMTDQDGGDIGQCDDYEISEDLRKEIVSKAIVMASREICEHVLKEI